MSSNKTIVRGLRASREFFDKCDLVAKGEGLDRNKLIIRVVSEYFASFERKQKRLKPCNLFFKDENGKWVELCNKDIQNAQENANTPIKSQDGKYNLLFKTENRNVKEVRECKCGAKFSAYINDKNDIYCNKCKHEKGLI